MANEELMHYGVPGMRWGVRKSPQSSGGSKQKSTKSKFDEWRDKRKAAKEAKEEPKPKKRKLSELSDEELRRRVNRLQLEKQYKDLAEQSSTAEKGKIFTKEWKKETTKKIVVDNAVDIGSQVVKHYMAKGANNLIGDKNDKGEIIERVFANNKKKS